jgi:hypothetical protein
MRYDRRFTPIITPENPMKQLTGALCLSAFALLAGCGSFASKPNTDIPTPPALRSVDIPDNAANVGISAFTVRVALDSKTAQDFDWSKQSTLSEQPLSAGDGLDTKGQKATHLLIGKPGFNDKDLVEILKKQGEVYTESSATVYTMDGQEVPLSTSDVSGYLVGLVCADAGDMLASGKHEKTKGYTFTPKVTPAGKIALGFTISDADSKTAPVSCDNGGEVTHLASLESASTLKGHLLISPSDAVVISSVGGMSKKNTNEVIVTMIKATVSK